MSFAHRYLSACREQTRTFASWGYSRIGDRSSKTGNLDTSHRKFFRFPYLARNSCKDPDQKFFLYNVNAISISVGIMEVDKDARTWATVCHLSALIMLVGVPLGNILGPLVVWLAKKQKYEFVDDQGKEALNFQITFTIVEIALFILIFLLVFGAPLHSQPVCLLSGRLSSGHADHDGPVRTEYRSGHNGRHQV